MANDPYTDDEYDDTYKKVHGDEPARDQYAGDDATDDAFFPSRAGGRLSSWGLWPTGSSGNTADAEYGGAETGGGGGGVSTDEDEGGSWWDEGLITLLLVGGLALFLFPEPATSAVGIVLMGVGLLAWAIDWLV